jgi:hypothetical protein
MRKPNKVFDFDPSAPNLGELRDQAAMHPVNAALAVASWAARKCWLEARVARFGPMVKPTFDELMEL